MVQLLDLRDAVLLMALISLIAAASAIALTEFQNSSTVTADSYADNITEDGLLGIDNTTTFLATIGTIFGVMVLVGVVVTAFDFSRR